MVPCHRPVYIFSLPQFDHHAQRITTHVSGETTSVCSVDNTTELFINLQEYE